MARSEKAIFTNMCMLYDEAGNILVQNRRKKDWPGITFPGKHVEKGESFVEAVSREVLEETGLEIAHPELCGIKQFHLKDGTRYIVFLYRTKEFSGQLRASDEGEVFWIKKQDLKKHQLATDFAELLTVFEKDNISEFYYENNWDYRLL